MLRAAPEPRWLIPKPLDPDTLLRTVREVLDTPPGGVGSPPAPT